MEAHNTPTWPILKENTGATRQTHISGYDTFGIDFPESIHNDLVLNQSFNAPVADYIMVRYQPREKTPYRFEVASEGEDKSVVLFNALQNKLPEFNEKFEPRLDECLF